MSKFSVRIILFSAEKLVCRRHAAAETRPRVFLPVTKESQNQTQTYCGSPKNHFLVAAARVLCYAAVSVCKRAGWFERQMFGQREGREYRFASHRRLRSQYSSQTNTPPPPRQAGAPGVVSDRFSWRLYCLSPQPPPFLVIFLHPGRTTQTVHKHETGGRRRAVRKPQLLHLPVVVCGGIEQRENAR